MKRNRYAYVIVFSQGRSLGKTFKGKPWKWIFKFCWQNPHVVWMLWGNWMLKLGTGSKHLHVMVTDTNLVCDYSFNGVGYYEYQHLFNDQSITGWSVVYADEPVTNWSEFDNRGVGKIQGLRLLYRTIAGVSLIASRGLIQHDTCVTLTKEVMRRCGADVPRRYWSPHLLLQWLTENGYAFTPGHPPAPHGSVD